MNMTAHKLLTDEVNETKKKSKKYTLKIPNMTGKFGVSLFVGRKEIFIGVSVGEVEIEQIVRRKMLKIPQKGTVKVFRWD